MVTAVANGLAPARGELTAARIAPVNALAIKFVGYVLWRGGKWYLRRRLPPTRTLVRNGLVGGLALVAMAIIARRLGG